MSVGTTNFLLTFLLVWTLLGLASSLQMTVHPPRFTPALPDRTNLSCVTQHESARTILLLEIGKTGQKPFAVINTDGEVSLSATSQANMKADGDISKAEGLTHLNLMIDHPSQEDAGSYTCRVFLLDKEYVVQAEETVANITVYNLDLESTVAYFLGRLQKQENTLDIQTQAYSSLQKTVSQLKDTVNQQKTLMEVQDGVIRGQMETVRKMNETILHQSKSLSLYQGYFNDLRESIERQPTGNDIIVLEDTVSWLNDSLNQQTMWNKDQDDVIDNQLKSFQKMVETIADQNTSLSLYQKHMDAAFKGIQESIEKLPKGQGSIGCAFSVRYNPADRISTGEVIKFRDIVTNVGHGYSPSTGLFTAPYDGVYVFLLEVTTFRAGDHATVILSKNGSHRVATSYAHDKDDGDQASTSCVLSLAAGDSVSSVVWDYAGSGRLHQYSKFTGFLISIL